MADLKNSKNVNLQSNLETRTHLPAAGVPSSGVLEFPVQMADKDFNEGLLKAAANVRRQVPANQRMAASWRQDGGKLAAPDALQAGTRRSCRVQQSTGAGFRVVDRPAVQQQEAESDTAAEVSETNTGGDKRLLEKEGAINVGTKTRPVRNRKKPDFLIVGDVYDPRFSRKHGG